MLQRAGKSSGQVLIPRDAIVVIKIPTVARIKGEVSPTAVRHSDLTNSVTGCGKFS